MLVSKLRSLQERDLLYLHNTHKMDSSLADLGEIYASQKKKYSSICEKSESIYAGSG